MFTDWKGVLVLTVAGGLLLWYTKKAVAETVSSAADTVTETAGEVAAAVDPTSRDNIFYQGLSRVVDWVADDGQQRDWGERFADWWYKIDTSGTAGQ